MHTYSYEAINPAGQIRRGEMQAASRDAVIEHLCRQGYTPLAAGQITAAAPPRLQLTLARTPRLSLNDIAFVTQELSVMLKAGLPLERALGVLASLAEQPQTKKFLGDVIEPMRNGSSFADALEAQKAPLPKGYAGMVRAGEAGGARVLETTLDRIADHLKRMQKARDSVFSAMLYPAIVLGMAALSITLILLFVLPQFEPLFQSAPAGALPLSTVIIVAAAHALRDYGLLVFIAALCAVFALRPLMRREPVQLRRDQTLLRLPKIGPVIAKAEMAKFCNTLGVLLSNGVPPVTALSIAAESLGNRVFMAAAQRIVVRVREGEPLSKPLQSEPVFPPLALQMIRIGEETGQLDTMLLKTAEIYDRDVQRSIERLMTLLTPITTIILGLIIGTIIAAVLSAILSLNDLVT
jgi:general secretion pathway protein F